MYEYYIERTRVYQNLRRLVNFIYDLTDSFPKSEQFSMVSQMRRSALSVLANYIEGNTRISKKDQANFITIAYSSLMELLGFAIIANDRKYLDDEDYVKIRREVNHISNQLIALRKAQVDK